MSVRLSRTKYNRLSSGFSALILLSNKLREFRMTDKNPVRVIVYEDGGTLVAQCLEYDICAHGADEDILKQRFAAVFEFEKNLSIERAGKPFGGLEPAPSEFHEMWDKCVRSSNLVSADERIEVKRCDEAA